MKPIAAGARVPKLRSDALSVGGWSNDLTGYGGNLHRARHTGFVAPAAIDSATAAALYRFNAVARRIITREPDDAVREGYTIEQVPEQLGKAIWDACEGTGQPGKRAGLGIARAVRKARIWARAFGGGAVIPIVDDGRQPDEPLDISNLRRVRKLVVLDRYKLQEDGYDLDPKSPTFGEIGWWRMTDAQGGLVTRIHASRVVPLQGIELTDEETMMNGGWGGSVLDLVWSELQNYATINDYTAEAVTLLTQGVFRSKNLGDALDAGDETSVTARYEAMRLAMGLFGDLVMDETESYEVISRPLNGLEAAIEGAVDALVTASGMPESILRGKTPAGLNNGENSGEIRAWYDHVSVAREQEMTPAMIQLVSLVLLSREGPTRGRVPDGWEFRWGALWQESELEREQRWLVAAQRRQVDVSSQVLSVEEVRSDPELPEMYPAFRVQQTVEAEVVLPEPGVESEGGAPPMPGAPTDIATTAMNGAQVSSLLEVVMAVARRELPVDSAVQVVMAAFPAGFPDEASARALVEPAALSEPPVGAEAPGAAGALPEGTQELEEVEDEEEEAAPSDDVPPDDLASPRDAGARFGVSTRTITRQMELGGLRYWALGGHRRVSLAEVSKLARSHEGSEE